MSGAILAKQFGLGAYTIGENVAGMTQEESLLAPQNGGNCANWVLGHIVKARSNLCALIGAEPVMSDEEGAIYDRGAPPLRADSPVLDVADLMQRYGRTQESVQAFFERASAADLERTLPEPHPILGDTVGSALTALAFHEAYHAGQLGVLRRVVGKAGALK